MVNLYPAISKHASCVRSLVLFLAVWFMGLFMGSYFQFSQWYHQSFIPVPYVVNVNYSQVPMVKPTIYSSIDDYCPFPVLDALDPQIKKYIKKYPTLKCAKSIASIVDVVGDKIIVNYKKLKEKLKLTSIEYCTYRSMRMTPGSDYKLTYGTWSRQFQTNITLVEKDENVIVDCYNKKKMVARSYHALVRKKNETETKRLEAFKKYVAENKPKETLSVLLVGIDGTAKQNLIRSMPKTKEFVVKHLNGIEFNKFNKVGLNTFPNVFPMLTGLDYTKLADWNYKIPFDKIDHLFLWNEFQKAGYRTSIIMDMVTITAFHYLKKGWNNYPFDFYPRPITIASEPDAVYRKESKNCMGDTPEVTALLDYWHQLTTAYNNSRSTPYFGYSFFARLTHDDQNKASAGDELYLRFFQTLVNNNVLNNTLLVFFSDHGERFGSIRNTYNGQIEAKTPFLFFIFPPWFEGKYPQLMNNLRNNTDRLMTMYDIHATLKDIHNFTGISIKASPLAKSISLFSEIPANRTCSVAGIPVQYCACTSVSRDNVTSSNLTSVLIDKFMKEIVSRTAKLRTKCEIIKHKETKYILVVKPEIPLKDKKMSLYQITLQTTPGDAIYEGTVTYKSDNNAVVVTSDISRLNMYRGQAECITDSTLRPFCFCSKKT